MLRITVHEKPPVLTIQVEGALVGPGVRELENCWQSAQVAHPNSSLSIDLTGVVRIDQAGIDCLEALYGGGAQFLTADCVMKDIVDRLAKSAKRARTGAVKASEENWITRKDDSVSRRK